MSNVDASFDLVVIGGGINGVGIAEAAAAAGYHTLVLEKNGIGSQTSASSSKLIHGGLRYLETAQFGLVRKSLQARRKLLELAPNLVRPIPFMIPVYEKSQRGLWILRLGLSIYRLLAGSDPLGHFRLLKRYEWSSLEGLQQKGLKGVIQYWDAYTDDQHLTQAVMASASRCGAQLLCPAEVSAIRQLSENQGYAIDYQVLDSSKEQIKQGTAHCSAVINCAGPWVNELLERVTPVALQAPIDWVQGSHILLDAPPPKQIFYLESQVDKRVVFVMPWNGHTMVGTTEVLFKALPDSITPTEQEQNYLLQIYQHYFPKAKVSIIGAFAGLRVLPIEGSDAFSRPRDTLLFKDTNHPNLLSVYGGKLTTYRDTAERALSWLRDRLGERKAEADYQTLPLYLLEAPPSSLVAKPQTSELEPGRCTE